MIHIQIFTNMKIVNNKKQTVSSLIIGHKKVLSLTNFLCRSANYLNALKF